jgi:hypothetical protein
MIEDTTQLDLREVDSTGTLKAGEKTLADLRKRKLIVQRLIQFHYRLDFQASGHSFSPLEIGKVNGSL